MRPFGRGCQVPLGRQLVLVAVFVAVAFSGPRVLAAATGPIWAKAAVRITVECETGVAHPVQRILAPGGALALEFSCRQVSGDVQTLHAQLVRGDGTTTPIELAVGNAFWRPEEVLWAPDSRSFLINGSENAYAGFALLVCRVETDAVEVSEPTGLAQRDMVRRFPPCRATNLDKRECARMEEHPQFNMSGLAWTRGGAALVVFAEVPCSSFYGGIMCQVEGYEVDSKTGKILTRWTAHEMKNDWQKAAAWDIRIPPAPDYGLSRTRK